MSFVLQPPAASFAPAPGPSQAGLLPAQPQLAAAPEQQHAQPLVVLPPAATDSGTIGGRGSVWKMDGSGAPGGTDGPGQPGVGQAGGLQGSSKAQLTGHPVDVRWPAQQPAQL